MACPATATEAGRMYTYRYAISAAVFGIRRRVNTVEATASGGMQRESQAPSLQMPFSGGHYVHSEPRDRL
jgi:hypothetical protein